MKVGPFGEPLGTPAITTAYKDLMQGFKALLLGGAVAALLSPAIAFAALPSYNGSAAFSGLTGMGVSRHQVCFRLQPKGGDYGEIDSDIVAGVAEACAIGVVSIDPVTGLPVTAGAITATTSGTAAADCANTVVAGAGKPISLNLFGAQCVVIVDKFNVPIDWTATSPVQLQAGTALAGKFKLSDGTTEAVVKAASTAPATTDPAVVVAQSNVPSLTCPNKIVVSLTANTDLHTFTNTGYICSIVLVGAAAESWGLVDGTGTVCATSIAGVLGGTTGTMAFAANGGFTAISDRAWLSLSAAAKHLCLIKSASGNISGVITYADF